MKKVGKYRFSLQFSDATEENVRAGELLERLGNRKSVVVVEAINEYMMSHPELSNEACEIHIASTPVAQTVPDDWKELVRKMIEEQLGKYSIENSGSNVESSEEELVEEVAEAISADVDAMLGFIDDFV